MVIRFQGENKSGDENQTVCANNVTTSTKLKGRYERGNISVYVTAG